MQTDSLTWNDFETLDMPDLTKKVNGAIGGVSDDQLRKRILGYFDTLDIDWEAASKMFGSDGQNLP